MNDKHVIIRGARLYEVHEYCQYSHLSWQGIISNISRATPIDKEIYPIFHQRLQSRVVFVQATRYELRRRYRWKKVPLT
jgi:hypothetical protein